MKIIPCQVKDCGEVAIAVLAAEGKVLGVLCEECRWKYMKRVRDHLNRSNPAEASKGWQLFCRKYGYKVLDTRYKPSLTPLGVVDEAPEAAEPSHSE